MKSLLEQLPAIVAEGKREAERVMERADSNFRLGLQPRELVIPSKDSNWRNIFHYGEKFGKSVAKEVNYLNQLIYGDSLLAMASLLSDWDTSSSMRGNIDLIYIDPPFDSKSDYRTKLSPRNADIEQRPAVIEQFAYSDMWVNGTASYLQMLVPRLCLIRDLLSEVGSVYVHVGPNVSSWVEIILQDIFGYSAGASDRPPWGGPG